MPPQSLAIESSDGASQEGLFEEAGLLRDRELDMKVRLGGLPHEAPQLPCVTLADVEAVLSAWTGIPPERMGQDDRDRLSVMEPALKVGGPFLPPFGLGACFYDPPDLHTGQLMFEGSQAKSATYTDCFA